MQAGFVRYLIMDWRKGSKWVDKQVGNAMIARPNYPKPKASQSSKNYDATNQIGWPTQSNRFHFQKVSLCQKFQTQVYKKYL